MKVVKSKILAAGSRPQAFSPMANLENRLDLQNVNALSTRIQFMRLYKHETRLLSNSHFIGQR